jgi:asparagine synthase (glutamine-hydrolysing)
VANSTAENLNPPPISEPSILSLSWEGWNEAFVDQGIHLFLNGYAAPDEGRTVMHATRGGGAYGAAIIDLYCRYGNDVVNHLRGSFALVLWDERQRSLLLAADHFGTRPIYYAMINQRIAFAPRLSAFAGAAEVRHVVEPNSLYFYLNHSFIPAPYTIYKDIRRLQAGQLLVWAHRQSEVRQYWDMTYVEDRSMSESTAADLLRDSLENSVQFALRSGSVNEAAMGAFLSGGTDSSTLVGLMAKTSRLAAKSFSVGFEEEAYNELYYARVAASHFNSVAHECIVRPDEALDAMPTLAEAFDEPQGNSSAVPTFFCVKMAKEAGIRVMLAGDGGDELFGGNERYITEKMFMIYHQVPRPLKSILDPAVEYLPDLTPWRKIKNYVRKANQSAVDRFFAYQLYYRDHASEFLTDEFRTQLEPDFPIEVARAHYCNAGEISPLNRLLYLDLKLAVADNDLFKVNRMAESQGVEVRYPYLDPRVGVVSGKIPANYKVKGWSKRYIFKKAFGNFLPEQILRKTKHGFGLPTGEWLRSHAGFRDLARSLLLEPRSIQRGYFQRAALERLLKTHDEERSSYFGSHIWNFMMLELWHRYHSETRHSTISSLSEKHF